MKPVLSLLTSLVCLAIVTGVMTNTLTATASAQEVVCPIAVYVGNVWIDHYPVTMENVGNGIALAVVLSRTRTVASPLGGMTTITENVWTVRRLGPGEKAGVQFHKDWPGSYSATAGACVKR